MEDDRPPADEPAADPSPPAAPVSPAVSTPVVSWGPPPGTVAPVNWAVVDIPALPPPPGTEYAGVGIRFLAWILDLVPLLVLAIVLFGPAFGDLMTAIINAMPERPRPGQTSFPEVQAAMAEAITAATPSLIRASALFQLGGLLYLAGSWLAFGRSPAMALLGLRIVREEDGARPGPARVAVRFGGYILSAVPFLLGFAWALFDNRNQAWHDKLAGTVVVRPIRTVAYRTAAWPTPQGSGWAPLPVDPVEVAAASTAPEPTSSDAPPYRRPSIGTVAEVALQTFRRAPLDLLASLAVVLVPTMIVLLPVIALYLVAQQDQAVLTFRFIGDVFDLSGDVGSDYAKMVEYNRQVLAAAAPTVLIGAVVGFCGSITGSLLIGACAGAVDEAGAVRPASAVTRVLLARLPALLALGIVAGALVALQVLLTGIASLSAASADPSTFDPNRAGLSVVLVLVTMPITIYFGAVWLLAVVCVVREGVGPVPAFRRAWELSRSRMRWLIGISLAIGLAAYVVLAPIGLLPLGFLAEDYIAGGRLPVAISVVALGLLVLLATPVISLAYVEAYRAARTDADAGATG